MAGGALRRALLAPDGGRRLPAGPAAGLRLEVDPASPLSLYLGLFELELAPHVRALCRPGCRSFDVGAYNGYYGLMFARRSGAPALCFESDEEACRRIERNRAANPGLAALVGVRHSYAAFEVNEAENCTTLDVAAASEGGFEPDLVKIDVEGAEASVLRGARGILAGRRPGVIVEVHSPELEHECGELLVEHGYAPRVVGQRKRLRQHGRSRAHNRWLVARGAQRHA